MAEEEQAQVKDEFAVLCDRILHRFAPTVPPLRSAMEDLRALHQAQLAAAERTLRARLRQLEQELNELQKEQEEADQTDAKAKLASMERDFQRQLDRATESYKAEIARMKASYEAQRASSAHTQGVVAQLHEDHRRELARVQEEWQRVVGNKDKEIARLQRRIDEEMCNALLQREANAQRSDEADKLIGELRHDLLTLQAAKNDVESAYRDELFRVMEEQKRSIAANRGMLNSFQEKMGDIELTFSRLRVLELKRSGSTNGSTSRRSSSSVPHLEGNGTRDTASHVNGDAAAASGAAVKGSLSSSSNVDDNELNDSLRHNLQEQLSSMQAREDAERQTREKLLEQAERIKDELSQITDSYRAQIGRQVEALQKLSTFSVAAKPDTPCAS